MSTQLCKKCLEFLPITDFVRLRKHENGNHVHCKRCRKKEYDRMYGQRKKLEQKKNDGVDVSYIKFSNLDFHKDHPNMLKMLSMIGYDPNKDIHEQFLKRVLMKSGEVLSKSERPNDFLSKYYK